MEPEIKYQAVKRLEWLIKHSKQGIPSWRHSIITLKGGKKVEVYKSCNKWYVGIDHGLTVKNMGYVDNLEDMVELLILIDKGKIS